MVSRSTFILALICAFCVLSVRPFQFVASLSARLGPSQLLPTSTSRRYRPLFASTQDAPLPPGLERLVAGFERMGDEKIRYKQLLFLATKLEAMPEALKTDANRVPGCLSTVHVSATCDEGGVQFKGDSDGLLTKGLVAMLVTGLSGCTAEEVSSL